MNIGCIDTSGREFPSGDRRAVTDAQPAERRSSPGSGTFRFTLIGDEDVCDASTAGDLLRRVRPVRSYTTCESILANFLGDPQLFALPVIDSRARPIALLDRKEYIEFFSKIYAREVFGRRCIIDLLEKADYKSSEPVIVEDDCSVEEVAKIILDRGMHHMVTGFLVTRGGIYAGISNGHDLLRVITERKQAELVGFNEELERRVAARTAELEAANFQLESFSYTIAHDLRAPVRAINGFAEMVRKAGADGLNAKAVEYLGRVINGSRRMGELIDDLLNLARLSRQEMRRREFNLSELASRVVSALAESQPQRRVDVRLEPGIRANGDHGLSRVLLENLIGNAWKYTARIEDAQIEIGRTGEGNAEFFVRDNGAGFDMQYSHKLFVPFQRLHHESEFEGTGIGLATVKKIVERHGGAVSIVSAPGCGTTVTFSLGRPA